MFAKIAKALTAAAVAGAAALQTARSDLTVSTEEWVTIVAAVLTAGVLTWLVPNKPAEAPDAVKSVRGY